MSGRNWIRWLFLIHKVRIHPNQPNDRNKLWSTQTPLLQWNWGGNRNIGNRRTGWWNWSTHNKMEHNPWALNKKQGKTNCNNWRRN